VFIADTAVNELPTAAELAMIAESSAQVARRLGHEPRVALLSFSTFGNPLRDSTQAVREAVHIMDTRELDFEYDGEMAADVALNRQLLALYPFARLKEPANVLVMPGLHSANIASKLVQELGGGTVIGPLLINLSHPVQIASPNATVSDLVNVAALAAHDARR
jgi:malate dehydrogenase (oxaloacetate-decarboxylating)(NADP+)